MYRSNDRYNTQQRVYRTPAERMAAKPVVMCKPIEVIVRGGNAEDVAKALKVFKRKVMDEGVIEAVRERQAYKKPSERKRAKIKKAKARARMERFRPMENDKDLE